MNLAIATPPFQRVRRAKVYEGVASQLQEQIAGGRFRPGDRLPPERELAEAFGVSRASVRDAIRVLELAGIVEPKQGDGTVVRELTLDTLVTPLASVLRSREDLLTDLLDARKIIEPHVAYRAAMAARPDDIAAMEEILQRQAAKVRRRELTVEEDTAFHYRLAVAARNQVVLRILDVLMDLLREGRERTLQVRGRAERSLAGHLRVLDAIKRRDSKGARNAMFQHLDEIAEILKVMTDRRAPRSQARGDEVAHERSKDSTPYERSKEGRHGHVRG